MVTQVYHSIYVFCVLFGKYISQVKKEREDFDKQPSLQLHLCTQSVLLLLCMRCSGCCKVKLCSLGHRSSRSPLSWISMFTSLLGLVTSLLPPAAAPSLLPFKTLSEARLNSPALLLQFYLEPTPIRLHPHHSPSCSVKVTRGLHGVESRDTPPPSPHLVPSAFGTADHPLLHETLPSLGFTALPLAGFPLTS